MGWLVYSLVKDHGHRLRAAGNSLSGHGGCMPLPFNEAWYVNGLAEDCECRPRGVANIGKYVQQRVRLRTGLHASDFSPF